jgi:prolyl oligopeptidase
MRHLLAHLAVFVTLPLIPAFAADAPSAASREQLRAVVAEYWNDLLKRHPIEATIYVGDHRYDDRINDASLAAYQAWIASLRETRKKLAAIEPGGLLPGERIDLEVLTAVIDDRLDLDRFGDHLIPLTQLVRTSTDVHTDDLHLVVSQLGEFQPASTPGDVENFVRRLHGVPKLVDGFVAVLKQGMAEKRLPPRVVMTRVVAQLRALSARKPEDSPLWVYITRLPDDWPVDARLAAIDRVRTSIENQVIPPYARLADFVEREYLPACRRSVGLGATPDGAEHYARLVRHYTTTDLTPQQVHEIGLAEMAKTRAAMEEIRNNVGFEGDLKAFFAHVRDDPKLKNLDESSILEGHRRIVATMEKNLPKLFGRLPLTPIEVRPFDPVRAKSGPTGEYLPIPSDGSRPGIFYVNTSEPTTRQSYMMQALAYHEAVPGHHLQGALALETPGRPLFRRYFYLPAFDEGWALYSEGLPGEIGLYADLYAEFGRLNFDAHRCARLVVDTGIHSQGWSRRRAIAYCEDNSSLPRNEIENEVDRYIAWPGQALAYKIGELTIRAIRAKAEKGEGRAFDIRTFHDRLLAVGTVPLRTLERVMDESPARATP